MLAKNVDQKEHFVTAKLKILLEQWLKVYSTDRIIN